MLVIVFIYSVISLKFSGEFDLTIGDVLDKGETVCLAEVVTRELSEFCIDCVKKRTDEDIDLMYNDEPRISESLCFVSLKESWAWLS